VLVAGLAALLAPALQSRLLVQQPVAIEYVIARYAWLVVAVVVVLVALDGVWRTARRA
jgi:hypothetical protein